MFRQAESARKRLNLHSVARIRSLEVARGRSGYGFTLCGQAPCLLGSILKGSPADYVGLKSGDQILSVNDVNVSKASHEDVVKLIGRCSGVLHLVIAEGSPHRDSCSSDEEFGFHETKSYWLKPKMDSKTLGINRAERVVAEMQSGGIFNMIFDNSSHSSGSLERAAPAKPRPLSEPDFPCRARSCSAKSHPDLLSEEEMAKVLNDDSAFAGAFEGAFENQEDFALDASVLNVGMIVGYLGSIELASAGANLESDSLQAIRGCMRRLRAEQRVHSLVMMKVMHDCVQLWSDRAPSWPPTQPRSWPSAPWRGPAPGRLHPRPGHRRVPGVPPHVPAAAAVRVGAVPGHGGVHRGVRARAFADGDLDAQQNHSTSSNSDSGIGNFLPEEKSSRVLLVDLGGGSGRHVPGGPWEGTQARSARPGRRAPQRLPLRAGGEVPPAGAVPPDPPPLLSGRPLGPCARMEDWRHGNASDQESYAESTDGWSSANCSTLPPMSKIPADRYRAAGEIARPSRLGSHKDEWAKKLLSAEEAFADQKSGKRGKDREKKGSRFGGLALGFPHLTQRSSGRRSFGRSKRLSLARSLDDLESAAVSDGELNSADLKGCGSENSLSSNASLPSVQSHRRHGERRVASWAVCFERLLQDPVGVRYFSEFLKKEFSEENILFWQACEYFSHVPENDKKQLSQRAREIYNSFLSSKATTPVNIDSQAQLADDILNAPRPDMFKEQQLQIFNLMKFDSYSRFLKSPLYQECMVAEVEGRALPDPYHIPSSPASSKHSVNSDRSAISTPKKDGKKAKPGRSLNEDYRDEHVDKKKGIFFSWSRNRSFGKGPKKRDFGDFNYDFSDRNGRRESQGSLSSGASVELGVSGSGEKRDSCVSFPQLCGEASSLPWRGDPRNAPSERDKAQRHCNINLPDGSCCPVPIRPGVSIRELLLGLCQKLCINLAAVDLFLVGGEKPLVLDQDCITLSSRDLRLEKRTLFRLDLVPINRSVGLKAKPTKPVTEVLRPVVAKYGLQLSHLVAKISGETEPLDLGLPISSLDGLRVILDVADHTSGKEKQKLVSSKSHAPPLNSRSYSTTGEEKPCSAKSRGEHGRPPRETRLLRKEESVDKVEKRKQKKINIDEAEEFFDLISKAQSNRANDQRGLLNKKDLVLPDFLRVGPDPACSTPNSRQPGPGGGGGAGRTGGAAERPEGQPPLPKPGLLPGLRGPPAASRRAADGRRSCPGGGGGGGRRPHPLDHAPFSTTLSPIPHAPPEKPRPTGRALPRRRLPEADFTPPPCRDADQSSPDPRSRSDAAEGSSGGRGRGPVSPQGVQGGASPLPANRIIDVDGVRLEDAPGDPDLSLSFEGYASELRECQGRMRRGVYNTSELPSLLNAPRPDSGQARDGACKATFV
ncbi:hypothetical protein ANANG_G00134670 [Anguilla anguilla]|uniref:Regulator of G protein signaling 12 n=1 Tax=Anguilla anguilla TaxID=7936 RepID=A0A9D3M9S1_ANGAN|nr:hypothetical protein ANANG_G00134670 [Anguilla anguilla]